MMSESFIDIERERASLIDEKALRTASHATWLTACDARLKELAARTSLLLDGVDLARIDRAYALLRIRGDANKVIVSADGHGRDARQCALADAKRWLAENPARLKEQYIGVKNYASFGDQRSDCPYNLGPKHGDIVFSIGLTEEARKRDL